MICHEENQLLREQLESTRKELKNSHNVLDDTYKKITLNKKLAEEKKNIETKLKRKHGLHL